MTLPTYNTNQWRIQGRGLGLPLYLDQIEAEKYFFGRPRPLLPQGLDDHPPTPPLLSEGLHPPLLMKYNKI